MKAMNKLVIFLGVSLITSNVFAEKQRIDFDFKEAGNFVCTAQGPEGMVSIDTHNILLDGACRGQYVVRKGHLKMPMSALNQVFFNARQPDFRSGNITVDYPAGELHCGIHETGGRKPFGHGDYC